MRCLGAEFHDFAGSIVVHAFGGWIGLAAVLRWAPASGATKRAAYSAFRRRRMPVARNGLLAAVHRLVRLQRDERADLEGVSGLVAMNSLMAMCGGILAALIAGKNDPGFVHNGALAGLVAVCAGSDVMHPIGALIDGRDRRRRIRADVPGLTRTAGRSTTCSACGRCTGCAGYGAASRAASSG